LTCINARVERACDANSVDWRYPATGLSHPGRPTFQRSTAMTGKFARAIALAAAVAMGAATTAEAAIGDGVLGARTPLAKITQVEKAQFFFGGRRFCWYPGGWKGPGWYWCGYSWRHGFGWGGGMGWQGWRHPGWGGPGWGGPGWRHPGWRHPGWRRWR
jgi:hypothetical protein